MKDDESAEVMKSSASTGTITAALSAGRGRVSKDLEGRHRLALAGHGRRF